MQIDTDRSRLLIRPIGLLSYLPQTSICFEVGRTVA